MPIDLVLLILEKNIGRSIGVSNEIISKLLKISDKNIEFLDNVTEEEIKGVIRIVVPCKLSYTQEVCPYCGSVNHNYLIENKRYSSK